VDLKELDPEIVLKLYRNHTYQNYKISPWPIWFLCANWSDRQRRCRGSNNRDTDARLKATRWNHYGCITLATLTKIRTKYARD